MREGLSLAFHQTRRTGALNRVIDRGVAALDYLVRFLGFNIGPTLIELMLAAYVLSTRYQPVVALLAVLIVVLLRRLHRAAHQLALPSSAASSTPPTPNCAPSPWTRSPTSRR